MISIRRLQSGDIATFRAMNAMFGTAFDDTATHEGAPSGDFYVESLFADPGIVMLAAFAETEVIGGLVAYELRKYERERSEFYIYDLAVAEPHRRRGIATQLIEALKPIAAARGGWAIFVQADHGDDPAIALYTKLGVREDVLHFDIDPSRRRD